MAALLSRILQAAGYTVLTAADGVAALTVLQASVPRVDVLLADIRMPRMTGDQLAIRAKELGLVRHILFMTGYDARPEAVQLLGHPILAKPFPPDELIRTLAAVVRAPRVH